MRIATLTRAACLLLAASPVLAQAPIDPEGIPQHDLTRPRPAVVTPVAGVPATVPGRPPSDAVVLFDGKGLSAWKSQKDGSPAAWKVENGYMEVVKGTGAIETRQSFADVQLHIEWMTPTPPTGESQGRGNSGVFFAGSRYEVQVLESYENKTYPDGQAGAVYGQFPPLVNASRLPGEWQAYDIVYEAPRFDATGAGTKRARELIGPTTNKVRTPYAAHPEALPISLQDHGNPMRFRNVWLRELKRP